MKTLKGIGVLCFVFVLVSIAHGGEYATGDPLSPMEPANPGPARVGIQPMDYGTGNWIQLNISTAGFIPLNDGQWSHFLGSTGWA